MTKTQKNAKTLSKVKVKLENINIKNIIYFF